MSKGVNNQTYEMKLEYIENFYNSPTQEFLEQLTDVYTCEDYMMNVIEFTIGSKGKIILKPYEIKNYKNQVISKVEEVQIMPEYISDIKKEIYVKEGNILRYYTNDVTSAPVNYEKFKYVKRTELGSEITKMVIQVREAGKKGYLRNQQPKKGVEERLRNLKAPDWFIALPLKSNRDAYVLNFIKFSVDWLDYKAVKKYGADVVLEAYRDKVYHLAIEGNDTARVVCSKMSSEHFNGDISWHHTNYRIFLNMMFKDREKGIWRKDIPDEKESKKSKSKGEVVNYPKISQYIQDNKKEDKYKELEENIDVYITNNIELLLKNKKHIDMNEENTKQCAIRSLIELLGYDTTNIDEVVHEYKPNKRRGKNDYRLDYLLKLQDYSKSIIIEAKDINSMVDTLDCKSQLTNYYGELIRNNYVLAIISNGEKMSFYTDTKKQNVMDEEPFHTINFTKITRNDIELLYIIQRKNIKTDKELKEKIQNFIEIKKQIKLIVK